MPSAAWSRRHPPWVPSCFGPETRALRSVFEPRMTSASPKCPLKRCHSSYLCPLSRFLSKIGCPVFGSWAGAALHKNYCLCLVRCWRWSWPAGDERWSRGIGELARGVAGWWLLVVPPGGSTARAACSSVNGGGNVLLASTDQVDECSGCCDHRDG